VLESFPRGVGRAVGPEDDILELIGDGGVHPEHDVEIGGPPFRVGEVRIRLLLDVVARVELGEYKEKEVVPLVVVADLRIELELNEASDVDAIRRWGRRY
jgi:hypothetical protein